LLIEQTIRRSAGGSGRSIHYGEFHNGCAPSRQAAKSAAVAPETK
jgi:hypothetical protein